MECNPCLLLACSPLCSHPPPGAGSPPRPPSVAGGLKIKRPLAPSLWVTGLQHIGPIAVVNLGLLFICYRQPKEKLTSSAYSVSGPGWMAGYLQLANSKISPSVPNLMIVESPSSYWSESPRYYLFLILKYAEQAGYIGDDTCISFCAYAHLHILPCLL